MKAIGSSLFSNEARTLEATLNQRLQKQKVIVSNIANSLTPGYRALGYDFESQLQNALASRDNGQMATSDPRHFRGDGALSGAGIQGDLYVKPTESVGNDGNTVDVDKEMADLAENQILYNFTVEVLNRKLAMLRYGINGG